MANFIVSVDPDRERQARFLKTVRALLPLADGLATDECSAGDFAAVWAAAGNAPISRWSDEQGTAVIWGDAFTRSGCGRMDAAQLRDAWRDPDRRKPDAFDGFHAVIVYDSRHGVCPGADVLGVFPVYYCALGETLLIGSSPELFRHHPQFKVEFNQAGLVGILLTMQLFDGQSLLRGVRRLAAGHLLHWRAGKDAIEVEQYKLPISRRYYDLSFSEHVRLLAEALDDAVRRQTSVAVSHSLMLSGGMDSRMLAGFLHRHNVHAISATIGIPSDLEMQCARRVARTLGFPHHVIQVPFDQYPSYAQIAANWEHVANGLNGMGRWGVNAPLRALAPRVVTGHLLDAIIGTRFINWAYSPVSRTMSFDTYFARINELGIHPEKLKKLLRREVFGDLVDETLARMRSLYESYGELESQRAWCFNLRHRQRFHVGSTAWAKCFGSWPVLLALDRRLLEAAGGMPAATLADRHAQEALLCRRFPALAALPLDRGSFDTEPLKPRLRWLLKQYVERRIEPVRRVVHGRNETSIERRYFNRVYDFNNEGWVAVRRQADPLRQRVYHLFHKEVLDEMLPPPDASVQFKDGILGPSGLKSILGFLLWSESHLN